jgi:ABC-type uncharacterized transport system substrate-binding protein
VRRRQLLALIGGGVISCPVRSHAQQRALPVIGILGVGIRDRPGIIRNLAGYREGLKEAGYVEGENVTIEYRWAEDHYDRLPALATDLVGRKVDVIVNEGGAPSALAAKNATSTIPIVFHTTDAVAEGLVSSLARPGGNTTGVSLLNDEILPKLVQMASELVPRTRVIALLVNPKTPTTEHDVRNAEQAASAMGVQLSVLRAGADGEIDTAFERLGELQAGALVVASDGFLNSRRGRIVVLAAHYAIPAISNVDRRFAADGGLLNYGPSFPAAYRIKGVYTGKILKGAKPADLPVQQPTTFELVINLKTAKALGLTVPPILLAQADEVIE